MTDLKPSAHVLQRLVLTKINLVLGFGPVWVSSPVIFAQANAGMPPTF